jgi:hypothetical protein
MDPKHLVGRSLFDPANAVLGDPRSETERTQDAYMRELRYDDATPVPAPSTAELRAHEVRFEQSKRHPRKRR